MISASQFFSTMRRAPPTLRRMRNRFPSPETSQLNAPASLTHVSANSESFGMVCNDSGKRRASKHSPRLRETKTDPLVPQIYSARIAMVGSIRNARRAGK